MKTPGTLRSLATQARISLFIPGALMEIPDDKVYSVSSYWQDLNYYGPKSRSSAAALGRYLSEDKRKELSNILDESDMEAGA